ncbi:putative DNA-binding domain protein [compost metagenome]
MADLLHDQLMQMAQHVRDPQHHEPPPGIEARRLAVYRQLFFGNVQFLLAGSFPVICASLGAQRWQALIQAFYADYRCRTPLFTELAGEFVDYLEGTMADNPDLPPWLTELAHYEWVESALLLRDSSDPAHDPNADLLDGVTLLSQLAWPLAYQWPVSEIGPEYLPTQAPEQPTLLLAQRGADLKVYFSRLAPLAHALLVSLQQQRCTGREHLQLLADALDVDQTAILPQGLALLEKLRAQGVVLIL